LAVLRQETLHSDIFDRLTGLVDIEVGPYRGGTSHLSIAERMHKHDHGILDQVSLMAIESLAVILE